MSSLAPTILLIVGLGFFPQPLLNVINPAVDEIASHVGQGDPAPKTPTHIGDAGSNEGGHE
jgi:NADH-quinone oxidoreductase subunit M